MFGGRRGSAFGGGIRLRPGHSAFGGGRGAVCVRRLLGHETSCPGRAVHAAAANLLDAGVRAALLEVAELFERLPEEQPATASAARASAPTLRASGGVSRTLIRCRAIPVPSAARSAASGRKTSEGPTSGAGAIPPKCLSQRSFIGGRQGWVANDGLGFPDLRFAKNLMWVDFRTKEDRLKVDGVGGA